MKIDKMIKGLPHFARGIVVTGFGRGSKELGIPTANFPEEVVSSLPKDLDTGIYFGWANVDNGAVHKMVMSIGWCPFYDNEKKSMETHIMHDYNGDFYGSILKVCVVGYLRPEKNFSSLDALIQAINDDIRLSTLYLDQEEFASLKDDSFFTESNNNIKDSAIPNGS